MIARQQWADLVPGPRVLVELSPNLDCDLWAARYKAGEVPDLRPYGLQHLADFGLEPVFNPPVRNPVARQAARAVAKVATGSRWVEGALASTHSFDVRFCWEESRAVPAAIIESRRRRPRPVVSGVIWCTEPDDTARIPRVVRRGLRSAEALYAFSPAQLDVLQSHWGIPSARLHFVPFGIDTDFWAPTGAEPTADLVVSAGNDKHRDHRTLIEAMTKARGSVPTAQLHLVSHREVIVPSPLGKRTPALVHTQLRDLYAQAAVVAVATTDNLHVSGITAILEAMSMGKPVVATDTPGMAEYVRDGETGLLVPPSDPDALSEAVTTLLKDTAGAATMGLAASEFVRRAFSTRHQAGHFAAIIARLT
jgi:glycosyltransferase involved in cell wall biosynthesis